MQHSSFWNSACDFVLESLLLLPLLCSLVFRWLSLLGQLERPSGLGLWGHVFLQLPPWGREFQTPVWVEG